MKPHANTVPLHVQKLWQKYRDVNRAHVKSLAWQAEVDMAEYMFELATVALNMVGQRIQAHEQRVQCWEKTGECPEPTTMTDDDRTDLSSSPSL
jgi:hypothetical protein